MLFGTIDTFLIWRLTGGKRHVTDVSNASRTLMFNIHTLDWDDELLALLGVPREDAARGARLERGLRRDRRRSCSAAADPGRRRRGRPAGGALRPGLLRAGHRQEHLRHRLLHAAEHRHRRRCRRRTACSPRSAGSSAARSPTPRGLRLHRRRGGAVAARRAQGDRGVGGGREAGRRRCRTPAACIWCPRSSGSARRTGTPTPAARSSASTRDTTIAPHRARRLESMAYQTRDVLDAMQKDAGIALGAAQGGRRRGRRTTPACSSRPTCSACPVRRPVVAETTALGAAYLAGLAVGYWKDTGDVARNWALDREFTPAMAVAERERLYAPLEEGGRRARSTGRRGSSDLVWHERHRGSRGAHRCAPRCSDLGQQRQCGHRSARLPLARSVQHTSSAGSATRAREGRR